MQRPRGWTYWSFWDGRSSRPRPRQTPHVIDNSSAHAYSQPFATMIDAGGLALVCALYTARRGTACLLSTVREARPTRGRARFACCYGSLQVPMI